ncbi:MAG: DUF4062 domain-containing protein, partial [Planctomycetota bacterium]
SEDLKLYRAAARDAAIAAGCLPIQMEYFSANGRHAPLAACRQKVAEADVLIVIVAYRYGWVPSDQDSGQSKSITWLECEQARADKKEVLAFLVDAEQPWDEKLKEEYRLTSALREGKATQELFGEVQLALNRLADFKAWIDSSVMRAEFTTPQDLGWKVSEALRDWNQRHTTPDTQPRDGSAAAAQPPAFPPAYREWLLRQCADIDLVGLRLKETRYVKLNHVYVPVTTPASRDQMAAEVPQLRERLEREPKMELLLDRLNEASLYVSGAPGSGKSTFCRWVTWLTCTGAMPEPREDEPEELRERFPASLRGRLPILIRLRDFWNFLPKVTGDELSLAQFAQALEHWLAEKQPGDLTWPTVAAHLQHGTALVIFDGVDEVPLSQGDRDLTWYPRASLLSGLSEAVAGWTAQGNRLLVTSRPYGLDEAERQRLGLPHAPIDDLPRSLQRLLAARWFRILSEDSSGGDSLAGEMLTDITQRPGIDQLSLSPMLLTAMCVIYREGKRLPQDRCDLYDRIVDNVLYNRVRDPARIEIVRNELRVVAHDMHTGKSSGRNRTSPEAEVDWHEIGSALESYRKNSRWTQEGFTDTIATREFLLSHTGLLLPRPGKRAAFLHLSIQEFLAAERLADASNEELAALFLERSEVPEWHNTLSFVFGTLQNGSLDRSVALVEQLLDKVETQQLGLQIVIGDALQILLAKNIRLQSEREKAYQQLCLSAIRPEVPLRERNLLGLALGRVGDPRVVDDLRELSAYVEIPVGDYAYQDGKQTIDQPFLLSKYPVTNSQFAMFVADGGYTQAKYWSKEGWKWKQANPITKKFCRTLQ